MLSKGKNIYYNELLQHHWSLNCALNAKPLATDDFYKSKDEVTFAIFELNSPILK